MGTSLALVLAFLVSSTIGSIQDSPASGTEDLAVIPGVVVHADGKPAADVEVLATRSLGSMIFGVKPLDPLTLIAVPAVVMLAGAIAALIPARRATRIDPIVALRGE